MDIHAGYALVIDQGHANRVFCRTILEQIGYVVHTADHTIAGLQLLEAKGPFDLLVVDQRLLELDDTGELDAAHKRCAPATIVLANDYVPEHGQPATLHDATVLKKPFSRDELYGAVIAAWQARHLGVHQRQAKQLAQAEKIAGMGRLSASIAHEINNPLQALQSSLKLLTERSLAEGKREQILHMANEQVGRLVGVVQQMMDLHRPAVYDGLRPVSTHELLESVLTLLAPQLQERGIVVERDWESALPRVRGVSSQLKQVFGSLILNAIDAMPEGGQLTVRTRRIDSTGNSQVQIEFADTGPGIAAQDLLHIFEPFYSTHAARTGLGLATSYSIVEQHAGALFVESSADGATFRVVLPAL